MTTLYIVRGLPGSGKSTYATGRGYTVEADNFFYRNGEYEFDSKFLVYAHVFCLGEVVSSLFQNRDIYVANTFTQWWEIEKYLKMARTMWADVEIVECLGEYESIHGVPADKIEQMRLRYLDNEKVRDRIKHINKTTPEYGFFDMQITFKQYKPETGETIHQGVIYEEKNSV